jgi:hypothetical protein
LRDLICDPFRGWMRCDAKPQNMSPAVPHDQQSIEQAKRDCRHDEHIHRSDPVSVVAEECPPALGRRVSSPDHVLGHAGLSDFDAELEEFSMDSRRSPQRIGNADLADKLAYLQRNCWPATPRFRFPSPIYTEASAVPFDDGPHPFRGGNVAVSVILYKVQRDNFAKGVMKFVEGVSSAIGIPANIGLLTKVGNAFIDGLDTLLGMPGTVPVMVTQLERRSPSPASNSRAIARPADERDRRRCGRGYP